MAQFAIDVSSLQSLFSQHLELFDEVAPKMLEEAAPILEAEVVARSPVDTGMLKKHIKLQKPKKTKTGAYISNVTITGTRTISGKSYRNMEIAAWNEYGTSFRDPRPFLRPAIAAKNDAVVAKMQEVYNREVDKIG